MAKRNTQMNDRSPLLVEQMNMLSRIAKDNPRVDYYRMCGTRKQGCRIIVDSTEIAEIWANDYKKKPDIDEANVGVVCTKYLSVIDKAEAIDVGNRDYYKMGGQLFEKYAYHPDWGFKWSKWAKTMKELYNIIIYVIDVFQNV